MESTSSGSFVHLKIASGFGLSIPLSTIERIIPLIAMTSLPFSMPYVVGVINLHGESIPVLDTALLLEQDNNTPYTIEEQIVICRSTQGKPCGFIVKDILAFERDTDIEHYMEEDLTTPCQLLKSAVIVAGRISYVFEVEGFINKNLQLLREVTGLENQEVIAE